MAKTLMEPREKQMASEWVKDIGNGKVPFSFVYGDRSSAEFIGSWKTDTQTTLGDGYRMHAVTYTDQTTGLVCLLDIKEYDDNPAVEWLVRFRNTAVTDTPILENILPMDIVYHHDAVRNPFVHHAGGTRAAIDDFQMRKSELNVARTVTLGGGFGRSSSKDMPFFNLEGDRKGLLVGVGWTGQWKAIIHRDKGDSRAIIHVQAGMELTHLKLLPGEEIRTPRILMLFWQDDITRAYNMLRRVMIRHYTPCIQGEPVQPLACMMTWGGMKTHNHLKNIQMIRDHKLDYDCYWIDAGWYGEDHDTEEYQCTYSEDWYFNVGNWRVNRAVHPNGFPPISDAAHEAGMKFLLWFEPERAVSGTPVVAEHPDWFLGSSTAHQIGLVTRTVTSYLLNLGNPEARQYLTDRVLAIICENGIDVYRQDCNMGQLDMWRAADAPDRQGITEIRFIVGLYTFLDDLLAGVPGLMIDNCAGGGTRLDFEMMSRSFSYCRTDYGVNAEHDPIGPQVGTYSLAHFAPMTGTGPNNIDFGDDYNFRSALGPGIAYSPIPSLSADEPDQDVLSEYPWDWLTRMLAEYKRSRKYFFGDFYPLTGCSTLSTEWMAYQMHRDDLNEGIVVALRRNECPVVSITSQLRGLDADGMYEFEDADGGSFTLSGGEAMTEGLVLHIDKKPGSQLLFYKRIR